MNEFRVYILFNVKKPELGNNFNRTWIDKRIQLFKDYTLKSLQQQTDQEFAIDLICCPGSATLFRLEDYAIPNVTLHFGTEDYFEYLNAYFNNVYLLKIDSDDLYHKNVVGLCKKSLSGTGIKVLSFINGYAYNLATKDINFFGNGVSFYCTYFGGDTFNFANFKKHCFCDQTIVRKQFNPLIVKDRMFCVLDHDLNLHKDPRRNGTELLKRNGFGAKVGELKNLKDFGIS